jgi:polyhydroxyalkanoate synthesis regulator phasin
MAKTLGNLSRTALSPFLAGKGGATMTKCDAKKLAAHILSDDPISPGEAKAWMVDLLALAEAQAEEIERLNKQLGTPYDLTVCRTRLDSSRQLVEALRAENERLEAELKEMHRRISDIQADLLAAGE